MPETAPSARPLLRVASVGFLIGGFLALVAGAWFLASSAYASGIAVVAVAVLLAVEGRFLERRSKWRSAGPVFGNDPRAGGYRSDVDKVGRLAYFAGWALIVGVIALLLSKAWSAAVVVAVLAAVNFGVAWRARART